MGDKNGMARFLGGLALMIVGLFILFNRVHVGPSGWYGWGRFSIGGFSFPSGLVIIPFIIGVVWMFGSRGSFASKLFTAFSLLLIVVAIILNTRFWLDYMTMFDWLLILVMIFGGGGIVASVLFGTGPGEEGKSGKETEKEAEAQSQRLQHIESELEKLKKNMNDKV